MGAGNSVLEYGELVLEAASKSDLEALTKVLASGDEVMRTTEGATKGMEPLDRRPCSPLVCRVFK